MNEKPRYATLRDLSEAIEKLEAKVPSRWEVRAIALGIFVASNSDVPDQVTTAAIAAGIVGLAGKALSVFLLRS